MTFGVAQLIREMVLLRDESEYLDSYLFRTAFAQGASGALLILKTEELQASQVKTEESGFVKCFSIGFEMDLFAATLTSWNKFLESRLKYGFEEDLDYFEATCIESTSKEQIFYYGHALRDGLGENCGCVIYSSTTASNHERMHSLIGGFTPLCLARLMAPAQAQWISEFEKSFQVAHINQSIFPIFGDIVRTLGHEINNVLATISLQLQSLSHNSESSSYVQTGVTRSLQAVQRIDRSVEVLEAFSSIVLNKSNTSFLESYVTATFTTLTTHFPKQFLTVSVDQNLELDTPIALDGPCLLFLIHNFLRTSYIVTPEISDDPLIANCVIGKCSEHLNCATLSISALLGPAIDPVMDFIRAYSGHKIGGPLAPQVVTVMIAAKKLGAEFKVLRKNDEVTLELHLPLESS